MGIIAEKSGWSMRVRATLDSALERVAWWMVDNVLSWAWVLALLVGCAGAPFDAQNDTGADVAGAPSRAGSAAAGGAQSVAGAAGVAGGNTAGNSAGGAVGSAGDGAELGGEAGTSSSAGAPATTVQPCSRVGWKLTAFASRADEPPSLALDGDASTRWASGTERAAGQWLELELGRAAQLAELFLENAEAEADLPDTLTVSVDGVRVPTRWQRVPGGVAGDLEEITTGRVVRLELDAPALGWWSVSEIEAGCVR